jgi:hypothetical protein
MLPGTFGVFETFRILIPGYMAALCGAWYIALSFAGFGAYVESTKLAGVTFAGFGLAAGLVLYFSYLPKDSKTYSEQQPSHHIFVRAEELSSPIEMKEAREIYFYLLNNYFSDAMRERVFYYGNVYRVGQKIWLISISFFVLGVITQVCFLIVGRLIPSMVGAAVFDAVMLALFLLLRWRAEKHALQILSGQVKWLKMRDGLVRSLILSATDPNVKP